MTSAVSILGGYSLADIKPKMKVFHDEVFGFVLNVTPIKDLTGTVRLCAIGGYGLAASIFTRNMSTATGFIHAVKSGNRHVN